MDIRTRSSNKVSKANTHSSSSLKGGSRRTNGVDLGDIRGLKSRSQQDLYFMGLQSLLSGQLGQPAPS